MEGTKHGTSESNESTRLRCSRSRVLPCCVWVPSWWTEGPRTCRHATAESSCQHCFSVAVTKLDHRIMMPGHHGVKLKYYDYRFSLDRHCQTLQCISFESGP